MLTVGSLFAGIGGFDLGFSRAGFNVRWQVENDPFCLAILEKHWPQASRYADIRTVTNLAPVDVVCGGFPCQPYSVAGKRVGARDGRHLWPQLRRIIDILRPRWIVCENVAGILSTDHGRVFEGILSDLADRGYDAEWQVLSASEFGAPHHRARIWIVAYPGRVGAQVPTPRIFPAEQELKRHTWWRFEPGMGRVAYGVPDRLDRLTRLGNALVPQIAEWIARRVIAAEQLTVGR